MMGYGYGSCFGGMWPFFGGFGGRGIFSAGLGGGILNLVFLLALIALGAFLVRLVIGQRDRNRDHHSPASPSALEILRQRYAASAIDREEYLLRKQDLVP